MLARLEEALTVDGVLKYSFDNTPVPIDDKMIEELAEFVLHTVELAGMQPPPYTYWNAPKPYKYNENGIPEGLKTDHFNGETINEWEPENET